jgi:c-di-GMP-binding flagellar brake protein YcgR
MMPTGPAPATPGSAYATRRTVRVDFEAAFDLRPSGVWRTATVVNVSLGGAGICTPEPVDFGRSHLVSAIFNLPLKEGDERIKVAGYIVHCRYSEELNGYYSGFEFRHVSVEDRHLVRRHILRLLRQKILDLKRTSALEPGQSKVSIF